MTQIFDDHAKRGQTIALSGYYGCGNLGDDLLLTVVVGELRQMMPGARFLVRGHGITGGLDSLGPEIVFTELDALLADQSRAKIWRLARYFSAWFRLLGHCRWLVFGGGTVFHARDSLVSLLTQWGICALARVQGVRIAALGIGVAELRRPAARWLLRRIIALTEVFLVRDRAGLAQCQGSKAQLTDDLVFSWTGLERFERLSPARPAAGQTGRIGFSLCSTAFRPGQRAAAVAAFVRLVHLWRERGRTVVFLAFWNRGHADDDLAFFAEINAALGPDNPVDVRAMTADPAVIADALSAVDVVCGMRFHGLVLAALANLPFVGLAHDTKISDICQSFAMPWLELADFTPERLATMTETALGLTPNPDLLQTRKANARANFHLLRSRL